MKFLAIIVAVGMAVFTAVSIAFAPTWVYRTVVSLGSLSISTFDLLFFLGVALLLASNAVRIRPERVPENRFILGVCWAYVAYQVFVVLPAAVLIHGLRVIDVFRLQEVRLSLILIPVTYAIVLRYWKPSVLIAVVDVAAAGLAIWVLYSYAAHGAQGYVESGVFRLRVVWGGSSLLFGWLLLTSLFYWPMRVWRIALAGLALVALGLANQRSGILALLMGFVAVLVAMRGVSRRALIALVLVVVVSLGVFFGASTVVRRSVEYSLATMVNPSSDQTARDRLTRSVLGIDYFEQHPLGDYVWNREFYLVNLGNADFVPHNFVVQFLVTQGAIASALYFVIIGATLLIAWRNRHDRLSSVMLAYLIFYLTFCLLNANIDLRENVSLFFIGVALVLHGNRERLLLVEPAPLHGGSTVESVAGDAADAGLAEDAGRV